MRIAVIEDDAYYSDIIDQTIKELEPTWKVEHFQYEPKEIYDAYFLDIELQGKQNGFEIAEKIKTIDHRIPIVFVSSHEELVCEGYKYQALRFIRKSHLTELKEAVEAVKKILDKQDIEIEVYSLSKEHAVINLGQVECLYSQGNYVYFLTVTNKIYRIRGTLKSFIQSYPSHGFVLAEKGMMVNPSHIIKIDQKQLCAYLTTGKKINISQRNFIYVFKSYVQAKRGYQ